MEVLAAAFCMNIFNCGLNQLCDIEIDKINKPDLPLASGELSVKTGTIIVASSVILDIPDMEGDAKFGIQSLSVRLGHKRGMGHAILASVLWYRAKYVDLNSNDAMHSFYVFIWKVMANFTNYLSFNIHFFLIIKSML
ncbi:hypothetical protein TanjilG_22717 [Lupinus angustifolius]|uniref:Uncharacterized protein n=1 Tax=Lupinus angustifolius TaxID=3871 RepID=A0A1J7G5E7_LUPAN|nr:hypothetical protein TanjilG_22717 [Lupinus angustifolius]